MMRAPKICARLAACAAVTALAVPASAAAATTPKFPASTTKNAWSFVSMPKLHPPKLTGDVVSRKGLASGDFFLGNFENITLGQPFAGQGGALIVDGNLNPVFFKPNSSEFVNNVAEQTFEGKPALSYWQGLISNTGVTESGEDIVLNQHYDQVAALKAAPGWVITQHELLIRGRDAWVTANSAPPYPSFDGHTIIDSAVQEYDLKTGKLLYNWTASGHIPLSASHQPPPPFPGAAWDAYHVNSIQLLPGGKSGEFLVSMRETWSAYLVDIATGKIIWTLDGSGTGGSFSLTSNEQFQWQHDVELHSGGYLTLFNDNFGELVYSASGASFAAPNGPSEGLLLKLNTQSHTVTYVHKYTIPGQTVETAFQGNTELLPNGNVLVGWGSQPFFSEFSHSGKLLFNGTFPQPDVSYRAYLVSNWVGLPHLSAMHQTARFVNGHTVIYATWNGATQVTAWRVLGGTDARHLKTMATGAKRGFETAIRLNNNAAVYKVQALDRHGHVLGTSSAFGLNGGGY